MVFTECFIRQIERRSHYGVVVGIHATNLDSIVQHE